MGYGQLWPAHPKPLPDELLSSWIVRVARANGIKLQTLSRLLFGDQRTPWNRDIDRTPPIWLLKAFSQHTGLSCRELLQTTLRTYRGHLYSQHRISGHQRWVLTIRSNGTKRQAYGLQFCPECLAQDDIPYFRKYWRVAFHTYCPIHQIALCDACPSCGEPVLCHRGDFNKEIWDALPMTSCYRCGFDFMTAKRCLVSFPSVELHSMFDQLLTSTMTQVNDVGRFDMEFLDVMHHFTRVMGTSRNDGALLNHLLAKICVPAEPKPTGWVSIEERRREERHVWLLCVLWLMDDLPTRLRESWVCGDILYSQALKDFERAPLWYCNIMELLGARLHR